MHEFSSVKALVQKINKQAEKAPSGKVRAIRLRIGGAFSIDSVRQAFDALSKGTPLEGVHLGIEHVVKHLQCACGLARDLTADETTGYVFVCPSCGDMLEIERGPELELLEIVSNSPALSAWCGNASTVKVTRAVET